MRMRSLLLVLALGLALNPGSVQGENQVYVRAFVGSDRTFRLSVRLDPKDFSALETPSLDASRHMPTPQNVTINGRSGVATGAGALVTGDDGSWVLYDAHRNIFASSKGSPTFVDQDQGYMQLPINTSQPDGTPQPCLNNGVFSAPMYYDEEGKVFAFAVSPYENDPKDVHCYGAGFSSNGTAPRAGWWILGHAADWYFAMPQDGYSYSSVYFELTGAAAVPPRHTMGFMATYWGYDTMQEVQTNMSRFRNEMYPIDSFIMDYDWFGPDACDGSAPLNCGDFGYKPDFWGNETFTYNGQTYQTSGPAELLNFFHSVMNFRWAGIRKPRTYSNIDFCNSSGWLLPDNYSVGAGDNNWNYSNADFRAWYTQNHLHFLEDGVDYWWNDEGETQWYTYLYWNMAQQQEWEAVRPNERMFTINRAFQPGMQRFPASTWTGDPQNCSHAYMLHFIVNGQPYTTCDMTSPDATVLLRQYQASVFFPIMRVHQMKGTPRFPFFWCGAGSAGNGTDEHCVGFRNALNLRYRLLPHMYSLAHNLYRNGEPIAHPGWYEFPSDENEFYMVGKTIIPGELAATYYDHASGPQHLNIENQSNTYLPSGTWFAFESSQTYQGPTTVRQTLGLQDFPIFVRAGAILLTNQEKVQRSDDLGGVLEVHVYDKADGTMTLVEDDGHSLNYQKGLTKDTQFVYTSMNRTLSWQSTVAPGYIGSPQDYTHVKAVLFVENQDPLETATVPLTASGNFTF